MRLGAVAAYVLLLGSLATPLYEPLAAGRNDSWALLVLVVFATVGLIVALWRRLGDRRGGLVAACFAVALAPAAWAAVETLKRGRHVPPAVEAQLPIRLSLGNLCPDAETPPGVERRLRAQAEALIRELGRRPNQLVTYTYFYEDGPDERRNITVRELAEEQLKDLAAGGPGCAPALERRIRAAL